MKRPEVVAFDIDGLASGDTTYGHRFMAPEPIKVRRFEDYVASLDKAKVVLDPQRRKEIILADARNLALAQGARTGRGRRPARGGRRPRRMAGRADGAFEPAFLEIPARKSSVPPSAPTRNASCCATRADAMIPTPSWPGLSRPSTRRRSAQTVKAQRVGTAWDGRDRPGHDGKKRRWRVASTRLANKFILVANLLASDGGVAIAAGNGRVVRARLSDARHFWLTDLAPLPDYKDKAEKAARSAPREAAGAEYCVSREAGDAGREGSIGL